MENNYFALTRRINGMDVHVWLTFLLILLLSGFTLISKMVQNVECTSYNISVTDVNGLVNDSLFVNEDVNFKVTVSKNVEWDFGDGAQGRGPHLNHRFLNEGRYTITSIVNSKCIGTTILNIHKRYVKPIPLNDIDPIRVAGNLQVGQNVTFTYIGSKKASSYKWTVINQDYQVQNAITATYNFSVAGNTTVQVQLNNIEALVYRKLVYIAALPTITSVSPIARPIRKRSAVVVALTVKADTPKVQPPAPTPPPAPLPQHTVNSPSDGVYFQMFENVIEGSMTEQNFTNVLCNGLTTRVLAVKGRMLKKDETTDETVESICKVLFRGKYSLQYVLPIRDPITKCVTTFRIKYNKKIL